MIILFSHLRMHYNISVRYGIFSFILVCVIQYSVRYGIFSFILVCVIQYSVRYGIFSFILSLCQYNVTHIFTMFNFSLKIFVHILYLYIMITPCTTKMKHLKLL